MPSSSSISHGQCGGFPGTSAKTWWAKDDYEREQRAKAWDARAAARPVIEEATKKAHAKGYKEGLAEGKKVASKSKKKT